MSVYTATPVHEPPSYEQRTLTLPARNLSQPERAVTPLRYLGSGDAPPPSGPIPQPQPAAVVQAPLPKPVQPVPVTAPAQAPVTVPIQKTVHTPGTPLDTVFFPVSANLVPDHYLPRLQHLAPGRCYLVVGHSDPTGPKPMILGLSVSRAASVATVMRTAGLRVDIEGVGSYGASHKPKDYPKDRRAEVWHHPCPGTPAPANPSPPPKADPGGISVQVTQDGNGQWQTTVTRRFDSKAAAQAWAARMQKQPPMQASNTNEQDDVASGNAGVYGTQLGHVGTVALGFRVMATRIEAEVSASGMVAEVESALNQSAATLSAALTAGVKQWLATSPVASFGNWREAMASFGSPIDALPRVTLSPATWNTTP